mgnify:CR=1 FL=1
MKHVVVDMATMISWYLPRPQSVHSQHLLRLSDSGRVFIHAIASMPTHVADHILRMRHRQPKISLNHMQLIMEAIAALPIFYCDDHPLLSAGLQIAIRLGVPVSQALSLALASAHDIPLCTVDPKLLALRVPSELEPFIVSVNDFAGQLQSA